MRNSEKRTVVQKCAWSPEEDAILMKMVSLHGPKRWSLISQSLEGRVGKQCRERWHNHLNPDVRKDAWAPEEDALIFDLVDALGTKWASISKQLPGRTDNSIKNRYYCSLKKFHDLKKASAAAVSVSVAPTSPEVLPIQSPPSPKRKRPSICSVLSVPETEHFSPSNAAVGSLSPCSVSESTSDASDEPKPDLKLHAFPPLQLPPSVHQALQQVHPPAKSLDKDFHKQKSPKKFRCQSKCRAGTKPTCLPTSQRGACATPLVSAVLGNLSPSCSQNDASCFDHTVSFDDLQDDFQLGHFEPFCVAPPSSRRSFICQVDAGDNLCIEDATRTQLPHDDFPLPPLSLICEYQYLLFHNLN
eukprot:c9777_g1_i1.p1 GENE.c9777_g1_i1~~c9777_g1_i1.p1  ORF type:complete len:358 (-),score=58.43 c9777_g1_i1:304-1377(-)